MAQRDITADQFDWERLYEALEETSGSLQPPNQSFSSASFLKSFASATSAETFTSRAWVKFSNYKRIVKDKVRRLKFELNVDRLQVASQTEFVDYTRREIDEYIDQQCYEGFKRVQRAQDLLIDVSLYMDAITKVSGRIKHFREDLGRHIKLAEIEKDSTDA